jgi:hypothetical protein
MSIKMAYMGCMSASKRESADWLLTCKDGKSLPCHSLLLTAASKTLASLDETVTTRADAKTTIPLDESSEVAEAFLGWIYSHTTSFEAPMAYQLAALAHRLDSPGRSLPQCASTEPSWIKMCGQKFACGKGGREF